MLNNSLSFFLENYTNIKIKDLSNNSFVKYKKELNSYTFYSKKNNLYEINIYNNHNIINKFNYYSNTYGFITLKFYSIYNNSKIKTIYLTDKFYHPLKVQKGVINFG